ncbi:MAG: L-lactate dehydrogenase [Syntrophorhabdus sp.]
MKIGIVGAGFVGSSAAFAIVMKGVATDVIIIDKNAALARAQAADILHAVPFGHSVTVRAGYYPDLTGASAVIIAAGRSRKMGESRLDLASDNMMMLREVIPSIIQYAPCAILVMTTNPVDIMTHVAIRIASTIDVAPSRIIGSGTVLDTARFRTLLGQFLDIDSNYVHAYVVGEHGDSEVMAWSLARVGGLTVDEISRILGKKLDDQVKWRISEEVRHAGRDIIAGKGATYYGIGSVLAHIIDVIAHDHRAILTVSTFMHDCEGVRDVTISRPHLLGSTGILASLPMSLDANERQALVKSAQTLRRVIDDLGYQAQK